MMGKTELERKLKYLREKGSFPPGMKGKEIGKLLDFHNQTVDEKHQDNFNRGITARNKYFAKLFLWQLKYGQRPYQRSSVLVEKSVKKGGDN
ncbi:MAG: hypothetical protein PHH57_07160 [Candidatus Omnitrophica bacterium]|jgi:hypothetical protein|nr:hypothetical protein [Candidatus Omnitrophota bacterium]